MKKYNLYQVDAFTTTKLSGNPAGVITNADGLTNRQMQQIARELNNSETAFILPATDPQANFQIRFFTPTTEVPICGHATIGSNFVRAVENNLATQTVIQQTQIGNLPIDIIKQNSNYQITMTQGPSSVDQPLPAATSYKILQALGIDNDQRNLDCPIAIASTGNPKVMIGLNSLDSLHQLTPNLSALKQISQEINCNGYFVFVITPQTEALIHARMFSPASGINEDPVTGNANGPLGAYLIKYGLVQPENDFFEFTAIQGERINRAGSMLVKVYLKNNSPQKIQIVGDAVIAFSTTLEI